MLRRSFILAAALGALTAPASAEIIDTVMGPVDVPENPQRIVVLTNEGTEAILALGLTPVGAVQSWTGDPWYPHISEAMADVEVLGTESAINLELIAALEPDLIIGNKLRQEKEYAQLSAIAPTVFSETLRGDWMHNFRIYAEAVGLSAEGDAIIADFEADVAATRDALGDAVNERISVVRFLAGQIRIYQLDTFSGVLLSQLGFERPDNQNVDGFMLQIGKESIPEMEGDRLFYFTYDTGDGEGEKLAAEVLADPLWANLDVVQSGNVHEVDDVIWNTAGGVLAAHLMLEDIRAIYGVAN